MGPKTASNSVSAGAAIMFLWISVLSVAPLLFKAFAWAGAALVTALTWKSIVFPHDWIVRRTMTGSLVAFSFDTAVLVAVAQWVSAAFVFGYVVRHRSMPATIWVAPVAVLAVALLVHLLIAAVGLAVDFDVP